MRKLLTSLLVLIYLIPLISIEAATLSPDSSVKVYLDGKPLTFDVDPIQTNGTTLVQFTPVFKALGMNYEWNPYRQTILGIKQDLELHLKINSKIATVNDVNIRLQAAPIVYEGRTLVPLRFISEATGMKVNWNPDDKRIDITSVEKPVLLKKTDYTDYTYGSNFNLSIDQVTTLLTPNKASTTGDDFLFYDMNYRNTLSFVNFMFDDNKNLYYVSAHTNDKNVKENPWDTYFTFVNELISVFGEPNEYYSYSPEVDVNTNYPNISNAETVEKMYRNLISTNKNENYQLRAEWHLKEYSITLTRMYYADGFDYEEARGVVFTIIKNKDPYIFW